MISWLKSPFARPEGVPLTRDESARFLAILLGLMVWLATLALMASLTLANLADRWTSALAGAITVEIPWAGDLPEARAEQLAHRDRALALLRQEARVAGAEPVPPETVQRLLEPWLGSGLTVADLPLPLLIDVSLQAPRGSDAAALAGLLAPAVPGAAVNDHQTWLRDLLALASRLQGLAWGVVLVTGGAAIMAVAFATAAGLTTHAPVIQVLHLMGAADAYIALQFQRHVLRTTALGALLGFVAALAVQLALLWSLAGSAGGAPGIAAGLDDRSLMLPQVRLSLGGYLALLLVPLVALVIATVTARRTVFATLKRLY